MDAGVGFRIQGLGFIFFFFCGGGGGGQDFKGITGGLVGV